MRYLFFLIFDAFPSLQNGLTSTMEVTVCSQDGEVSLNFILPEGLTEETCSTSLVCAYQVTLYVKGFIVRKKGLWSRKRH